jgi:CRISPR-associated protein Csx17
MTLHLHHLIGCAPAPLAHYLKALAVLRLVGEQKDPEARGFWQDEHFCLLSALDRDQLERFFLEEYSPTPAFNPWGARSGFYPGSSESAARKALTRLVKEQAPRFQQLREAFALARQSVENAGGAKPNTDDAKSGFVGHLRAAFRGSAERWLAAVIVSVGESDRSPALFGTGGNEGSGSYCSTYLQALVACLLEDRRQEALGLFSDHNGGLGPTLNYAWSGSFGQFLPSGVGSAWDFVFVVEGAILLRSSVTLRSAAGETGSRFLASPFYFAPHAVGPVAAGPLDEYALNKGKRLPGRGEQWFPIWSTPASLTEIEAVFAQSRCSVGKRQATRVLDAAQAINRLGVATGIRRFTRFGYIQRLNLTSHLAVPLGRIEVRDRPRARLIDDLSAWLDRLQRAARDGNAPARLVHAERRLADAVFAVLTHDDAPGRWQAVLAAASGIEAIQAAGTAFRAGPIPPLSAEWLRAADDGSVEWRLACALGSAAGAYDRDGRPRDSVRCHWLPLDGWGRRYREKEKRIIRGPRVVATGGDDLADCLAVVERRLIEAAQRGDRRLPLLAARGAEAGPADLAELVAGRVDLSRVVALARALMAVRWGAGGISVGTLVAAPYCPDEPWMAIRLACLPWPLDERRTVAVDDAVVRRLRAGDAAAAIEIALRRLRAAGLRAPIQAATVRPATAQLWGAALAFPISRRVAGVMARRFDPESHKEST